MSDISTRRNINLIIVQIVGGMVLSILVGIGSAAVTSTNMITRIEERVIALEKDVKRHEATLEKDLKRLEGEDTLVKQQAKDHERRISTLESIIVVFRDDLTEIKQDVKIILRGGNAR